MPQYILILPKLLHISWRTTKLINKNPHKVGPILVYTILNSRVCHKITKVYGDADMENCKKRLIEKRQFLSYCHFEKKKLFRLDWSMDQPYKRKDDSL